MLSLHSHGVSAPLMTLSSGKSPQVFPESFTLQSLMNHEEIAI